MDEVFVDDDALKIIMDETLKKIFGAVIIGDMSTQDANYESKSKIVQMCVPRFLNTFPINVFEEEYAFFYMLLTKIKVRALTSNQLGQIIEKSKDLLYENPCFSFDKYVTSNGNQLTKGEKLEYFKIHVSRLSQELSNMMVSEEEFDSSCKLYLKYYKDKFKKDTLTNCFMIMEEEGYVEKQPNGKKQQLKGIEDCDKYWNSRASQLRALDGEKRVIEYALDDKWELEEMQREVDGNSDEGILDTGIIEIDEKIKSFRRSNMVAILGPPKGGKTRFTNYLVERALEKGLNVCVWAIEGTSEEWIANQIALMTRKKGDGITLLKEGITLEQASRMLPEDKYQPLYDKKGNIIKGKYKIIGYNSKDILEKEYQNDVMRQKCNIARAEMVNSTNKDGVQRGKLSFIQATAYIEDFVDVLQNHYDTINAFDVIVMDQLINVLSKDGKEKITRISEAYMKMKDFITNKMERKPLALIPTQLKQEVVNRLRQDTTGNETIDVTAGGESAETIRTPDEVIGLFSSKEERRNNVMKIYSVASRHSENFEDFYCHCELGCCYFESDSELNAKLKSQNLEKVQEN